MDDREYSRDNPKWYNSLSEDKMTAQVTIYHEDDEDDCEEDVEFPIKFEVCSLCEGKGKHVNPSVDSHGISAWEFEEDPDFKESYFNGLYDVTCYECHGKRVVPEINEEAFNEEQKKYWKIYQDNERDRYEFDCVQAAERRMGA
jgi:hypothetical protein